LCCSVHIVLFCAYCVVLFILCCSVYIVFSFVYCVVLCILCCSVYCFCLNVYCTAATGCQPNCSQHIYIYIYWYYRERQKYYQHSGVLNRRRAPVICTRLPQTPGRYCFELRSDGSEYDPNLVGLIYQVLAQYSEISRIGVWILRPEDDTRDKSPYRDCSVLLRLVHYREPS